MLTRIFILLTIFSVCYCEWCGCGNSYYSRKKVSNCGVCGESSCKKECAWAYMSNEDDICYWNYHSKTCVKTGGILSFTKDQNIYSNFKIDMKVDCGNTIHEAHCGNCWGGEENCGGECHWLEDANYCVHTSGPTSKYLFYFIK